MKSTIRGIDSKLGDLVSELKENSKAAAKDKNIPSSLSRTENKDETEEINKSSKNGEKNSSAVAAVAGATPDAAPGSASPSIDIRV